MPCTCSQNLSGRLALHLAVGAAQHSCLQQVALRAAARTAGLSPLTCSCSSSDTVKDRSSICKAQLAQLLAAVHAQLQGC